jgi:hypothetical protein
MTTTRADAIRPFQVERGQYGPDTYCLPVEATLRALHALYTALREAELAGGHRKPAPTPPART